jgi:hypothetical protein
LRENRLARLGQGCVDRITISNRSIEFMGQDDGCLIRDPNCMAITAGIPF